MERRNKTSQSETKRIVSKLVKAIAEVIIYSILLWQLLACTNSLFIVKGYGNHVNKIDFFKDLLKYKTILPMYLLICNRSVAECKKELERLESEQCTH